MSQAASFVGVEPARLDPAAQAEIAQTGLVPADVATVVAPAAAIAPKPRPQNSVFKHAVYVIRENPVTGLAFGLYVIIVICAVFGPLVAPYDPLVSDPDAAYPAP